MSSIIGNVYSSKTDSYVWVVISSKWALGLQGGGYMGFGSYQGGSEYFVSREYKQVWL